MAGDGIAPPHPENNRVILITGRGIVFNDTLANTKKTLSTVSINPNTNTKLTMSHDNHKM